MPQLSDALLDGKTVLVSGGTQGLGAAVAAACVRNGADVVGTGRPKDAGEQFAAELPRRSGQAGSFIPGPAGGGSPGPAGGAGAGDPAGPDGSPVDSPGL